MRNIALSVIMPNYNYAHYIGEALEAILSQSFRPREVIVVDDGSTDDSVAVIEQFARRDSVVHLLRNGQNMGVVFAANRGLEHATGDYVYFAAADDKVLPGLFKKSMELLSQYPQAGLCCSDYFYMEAPKGVFREKKFHLSSKSRYFSATELAELIRKRYFPIGGATIIMKRKALREIGGFDHNLGWQCDWFVDFVVGFRYGMCYIPETLAIARLHSKCNSLLHNRQSLIQLYNLKHMLRLLMSNQYCDVFTFFQRAGILSRFKFQVLIKLFVSNDEYKIFMTPLLLCRSLWLKTLSTLSPITPSLVKRLYNRIYYRQYTQHKK